MALDFPSSPATGQLYTGPDGTVWKWDGAKWVSGVTTGVLSASQMDLGTRLAAAGTKLNALGPTTSNNSYTGAAAVVPALDAAMNYYAGGSATPEWTLPTATTGMVLSILLAAATRTTIRPSGTDTILAPAGHSYNNGTPLIVPLTPLMNLALIHLHAPYPGGWQVMSASSEIQEAMGWVTRPYFQAVFNAANLAITSAVWTHAPMDTVQLDNFGWWSSGAQQYVPKRKGVYRATFDANMQAANGISACYAGLYVNGAGVGARSMQQNPTNGLPMIVPITCTSLLTCNGTTDYIEPYVYIAAAGATITGGGNNQFMIEYIGP